jgi:hypothetical protein
MFAFHSQCCASRPFDLGRGSTALLSADPVAPLIFTLQLTRQRLPKPKFTAVDLSHRKLCRSKEAADWDRRLVRSQVACG